MKLLENNNRKFIRTLSNNCLKANRGRNSIAVIAVILTAVMFMALTTVLEGTQISMKNQMLRQVGTKFMVSLKNLTQEEAERLVMAPEFAIAGIEQSVASAVNSALNNVSVSIGWMDTVVTENSFMHLEAGHAPETSMKLHAIQRFCVCWGCRRRRLDVRLYCSIRQARS